jgi:hypothetical protein
LAPSGGISGFTIRALYLGAVAAGFFGVDEKQWFIFYHDPYMAACRFDQKGNVIEEFSTG